MTGRDKTDSDHIARSVELAIGNVAEGGSPFGAVLVRDGAVVAEGVNETHLTHDPTAHAEVQAMRHAAGRLKSPDLSGMTMYASGMPCAVCMAAMMNAGIARVVYCADDDAGRPYGWATEPLYDRLREPVGQQGIAVVHLPAGNQTEPFALWQERFGRP